MSHLPVLQVIIPLLSAPIVVLLGRRWAWPVTSLVGLVTAGISLALLSLALSGDPMLYAMGGWTAPVGIVYRVDVLSGLLLTIIGVVGAVVLVFARQSVAHEISEDRQHLFYAVMLLCISGLMGICITADVFNVFVFLEISSLSAYALIAMGRSPRALTAAYRYLIMGTIGGTFVLLGIGLLYMMTGTLNMDDLASRIPAVADTSTVRAAFAFMTVGALIKLAVVPLHFWLPNAYTYAPSVVSAFLSATATKVSFYVLVRITFMLFGVSLLAQTLYMSKVLLPLSLIAIVGGSLVAVFQTDVKRLLAYSSLAQIGYFVLGLALHNVTALTGSLIHLFNHAMMKGGLFMVLGCVVYRLGGASLDQMKGLGRRMPITAFAFVIGGLGLIGVPLTAGFVSKWYLIVGAFEMGQWWVAGVILFSSLIAVAYIWRVVEVMYFSEPVESEICEAPLGLLIPTYTMIIASIIFGIWTAPMLHVASSAAEMLFGGMR